MARAAHARLNNGDERIPADLGVMDTLHWLNGWDSVEPDLVYKP